MDFYLHFARTLQRSLFSLAFLLILSLIQPAFAGTDLDKSQESGFKGKHFVVFPHLAGSIQDCSANVPGLEILFPPQLAPPVINGVSFTQPTDCGVNDGTITIDAISSDPMEYSINSGATWFPDNIFIDLPPNSYTILVRNVGDLTEIAYPNNPVVLDAPLAPVINGVSSTDPADCTATDGTITITATAGSSPTAYSIDGGQNWQSGNVFSNLGNGLYEVMVRNDNGSCEVIHGSNPIELFSSDAPDIQSVTPSPTSACGVDDGQIVIVGSGSGALEYSIDGGGDWRTINTFDDLAAGAYNIVVRNFGGTCEVPYAANPVTVGGLLPPEIVEVVALDISDCGADDGSITVISNPGFGFVEYSIDGGFIFLPDSSFTNLGPGSYAVAIRYIDDSCEVPYRDNPIEFTDPQNPVIVGVDSVDLNSCVNDNGEINILANGDRELFYSIDGGTNYQTDNSFTGLAAGNYDIVVAYAGQACVDTHPNLSLENDGSGAVTVSTTPVEACLNATGVYTLDENAISVNGEPFGPGFSLTYSSAAGTFADANDPNTTITIGNNQAGNVSLNVLVTDDNSGCADLASLTLSILEAPVTNMVPATVCAGEPVTLSSGTPGLHQWSVLSGDANSLSCTNCPSPIVTPQVTTVYGLTVTNLLVNNCATVDSVEIEVYDGPVVVNHRDTLGLCIGDTLKVSLELSENIATYNISTFGEFANDQVSGNILTFDAIMPGSIASYQVDFTGNSGCSTTDNFIIHRVTAPTASFNFTPPTCAQSEVLIEFTGTASSSAVLNWDLDGGTLVYASPQMGVNPAGSQITASWPALGSYEVKLAVDDGGCVDNDTMTLAINNTAPQLSYTVTPAASCGTSFGAIDLTATGGNNEYSWEGVNGFVAITQDISGLQPGIYAVTVTDLTTSCSNTETIEVGEDGLYNCTDYVRILIPAREPYNVCLDDVVNLPGPIISGQVCGDDPATVEVSVNQGDDCIVLDPNDLFIGEDTICVVHCDGNSPVNCDTTFVVVMVSPPTDTIQVNVLGDIRSEICIPGSALQIGGTITSAKFCDRGNPATVEGVALAAECVTVQAAQGFTGLSPDMICVIHCYDNFALFCDTTYIEITVDPNNCSDFIAEEEITIPLADCNNPIGVCIGVPFSTITDFDVRDNGKTYTGGFQSCGTDSTEVILTQGLHVLSFREIATGCPDTIIVDVDNGLAVYSGETAFEVACDSILSLCLDIPFGEAGDYEITDNGMLLSTSMGCGLDSFYVYDYSNIPGQGGSGFYLLQNWTVNGSVFIGSFSVMSELVDSMNAWDPTGMWTLDAGNLTINGGDFNNTYSPTIAVSEISGASGTIDLSVTYAPANVMIQLDTGYHELIVMHLTSACFEAIDIVSNCLVDCPDNLVGPVTIETGSCDDLVDFCTGISSTDLVDYNIYDNGAAYTGSFGGCDNTNFTDYSFAGLPGQGNTGPYEVISWSIGPVIHSGITFMDLTELLAEMQALDPAGNWTLNGTTIMGDHANGIYGTFQIDFGGSIYPVYPTPRIVSASTSVQLDTGYHQLVLEYLPNGCLDTVEVYVNCPTDCGEFIAEENVSLPLTDCTSNGLFCVDIDFAEIGNFTITDNNFPYANGTAVCPGSYGFATQLSLEQGVHELIFTENNSGCSDTVSVVVSCANSSTQVVEVIVNTTDTVCVDDTQLLGNIISNTNVCPDASGEFATVVSVAGTFCYEISGIELGQDSACIVLCDDEGFCDTTYLLINVVDEINPGDLPLATADATSTYEGQLVSYDVLANDLINGTLDTFYILNQPDNGFAWYDSTGTVHYQPDEDFCDFANPEMIAYTFCNELACDTSELLITVLCEDIQTFSGFSPNGDGINDNFIIQGAELYPENQLFIFSRWGTLIFKTTGYVNDWDGTWNGSPLPEGTYFYIFDTGTQERYNGYLQIQR